MVRDSSEQIEEIVWNVQGKVQEVHFEAGKPGPSVLQYEYDPMGNRLAKKKLYVDGPADIRSEGQYYVRDPQGNVLAVYQYNEENIALVDDKDSLYLEELHLYGSARLGILKKALALRYRDESGAVGLPAGSLLKTTLAQSSYQQLELGRRRYELSNHLGNVLATVSDKSLGQDSSQTGQADYYLAQVSSASLYYPFGWEMPGRKFVSGEGYRFGFNGQEEDPDIAEGNLDFGARNYDGRIGRWWSVDPLVDKYPQSSPYVYVLNNPIFYIDPKGMEPEPPKVILIFYHGGPGGDGKPYKNYKDAPKGTGEIYKSSYVYAEQAGFEVTGQIIAPALTQGKGVAQGKYFLEKTYKKGDRVIIYGYSYGGDNAVNLAKAAEELDIDVDLLVIVDSSDGPLSGSTVETEVPDNVTRAYNFYQTKTSGTSSFSGASSGSDQPDADSDSSSEDSSSDGTSNSPGSRGYRHSSAGKAEVHNIRILEGPKSGKITHAKIQKQAKGNIMERIQKGVDDCW